MDRKLRYIILWACLLLPLLGVLAQGLPTIELLELKAFPTAHGPGRYAVGGRGGVVLKVTNTNSSGPGSFKQAYDDTSGARTIIFEDDGYMQYSGVIFAANDFVTVAGQTAPGDGFGIYSTTDGHESRASNVIFRHFKFRGSEGNRSNFRIRAAASTGSVSDVILDHVSLSWSDPDEMSIEVSAETGYTASEITAQYLISGEVDRNILIFQRAFEVGVYRSLLTHSNQRGTRSNWPDLLADNVQLVEQSNTILHGWRTAPISWQYGMRGTVQGNIYTQSDNISLSPSAVDYLVQAVQDNNGNGLGTLSDTYIYATDNTNEWSPSDVISPTFSPYLEASPMSPTDYTDSDNVWAAADLEDDILPYMGAFWWDRDVVDTRLVDDFINRTGTYTTDGTIPTPSSGTPPTDDDEDGMPEWFEDLHGLDDNNAGDRNDFKTNWTFPGLCNLINTADYTNLEIYLAYAAKDFELMVNGIEKPDGSFTITTPTIEESLFINPYHSWRLRGSNGQLKIKQ